MRTRSSALVATTANRRTSTRQKYIRKTRTPQIIIKTEELAEKELKEKELQDDASDDILDTVIKNEETNEDIKHILELPDINDPNNYCRACGTTFTSRGSYCQHLRMIHHMKNSAGRSKKNLQIIPDMFDSNFYCKSCDRAYKQKSSYHTHLKLVHKMKPKLFRQNRSPIVYKRTDIDEANLHCRPCNATFSTTKLYQYHLTYTHNIRRLPTKTPLTDSTCLPDIKDPDSYCKLCGTFYTTRKFYRKHLRAQHKIEFKVPAKKSEHNKGDILLPDPTDPQLRCSVCNKDYLTEAGFRVHLRNIHKMELEPLKKYPEGIKYLEPDPYDADFYCRVCDCMYSHTKAYKFHLMTMHNISKGLKKAPIDRPDLLPDYDGSNTYYNLESKQKTHPKKMNSNITPDVNHPEYHCISCNHTYDNNRSYLRHLRNTHKIEKNENTLNLSPVERDGIKYSGNELTCKMCNAVLFYKRTYIIHMLNTHKLVNRPLILDRNNSTRSIIPETEAYSTSPTTTYCQICDFTFDSVNLFIRHLIDLHHIECEPVSTNDPIIFSKKEIDDPEFTYCKICEIEFLTKALFSTHMEHYHEVNVESPATREKKLETKPTDNIIPKLDDPNNYCRVCDRGYKNRRGYCTHLSIAHGIIAKKPNCKVPDPEHSKFYCCSCKRSHVSKEEYINHLISVHNYPGEINGHQEHSAPSIRFNTLDVPNPKKANEPSELSRCSLCDKTFKTYSKYRNHMSQCHKIYAPTLLHTTNLANRCLKCNITFRNKTFSSEHKKQFHSSSNETVIKIE